MASLAFAKDATTLPPILKAAKVAYYDYNHKLITEGTNDNSQFARYAKNISNYEIVIKEYPSFYVIIFTLKAPPGEMIFGGHAEYKINRDFKIVNFRGSM
jgi:hypothetical protein